MSRAVVVITNSHRNQSDRQAKITIIIIIAVISYDHHFTSFAYCTSSLLYTTKSSHQPPITNIMSPKDYVLAAIPMLLPTWYLLELMDQNPLAVIGRWVEQGVRSLLSQQKEPLEQPSVPPVGSQLLAYMGVAIFGFIVTNHLIPNIQVWICQPRKR